MTTDQLEQALRAADPTTARDPLPHPDVTVRAARAVADRATGRIPSRVPHRRRPVRVTLAGAAALAAAALVAVPVLTPRTAPDAGAAIQLVAFTGLLDPWVLTTVPAGLGPADFDGRDGVTTAFYDVTASPADGVHVTHSRARFTEPAAAAPGASATRRQPDGSWLTVDGYGRFGEDGQVRQLLADVRAVPTASALGFTLDTAPAGWALERFKGCGPVSCNLVLTPPGGGTAQDGVLDSGPTINVVRTGVPDSPFPPGIPDPAPSAPFTSRGRAGIVVQDPSSWSVQLALPGGGALQIYLPADLDRDQVQRFCDGVTVPAA